MALRRAGDGIRLSEHLDGTDGETVFLHACRMGLEGIVAKRRDRPYRSGRTTEWVKIKNPATPSATRIIEVQRTVFAGIPRLRKKTYNHVGCTGAHE